MIFGLLGGLFFWVTDPHIGPKGQGAPRPHHTVDWRHVLFVLRGSPDNLIDAANQALVGTVIGLVGSSAILATGCFLVTRRQL